MSHQMQLTKATDDERVIYDTACRLFQESWSGEPVRLLGIRTAKLVEKDAPQQLTIFDMPGMPDIVNPPENAHSAHEEEGCESSRAPAHDAASGNAISVDIEIPEKADEKHQRLKAAMEEIRKRYGEKSVRKAKDLL